MYWSVIFAYIYTPSYYILDGVWVYVVGRWSLDPNVLRQFQSCVCLLENCQLLWRVLALQPFYNNNAVNTQEEWGNTAFCDLF